MRTASIAVDSSVATTDRAAGSDGSAPCSRPSTLCTSPSSDKTSVCTRAVSIETVTAPPVRVWISLRARSAACSAASAVTRLAPSSVAIAGMASTPSSAPTMARPSVTMRAVSSVTVVMLPFWVTAQAASMALPDSIARRSRERREN